MAIDPTLRPGVQRYRAGDWTGARRAFEAAGGEVDRHDAPEEHALLAALGDLAAALEARDAGRSREAVSLAEAAQGRLAGLPDRLLGLDVAALGRAVDDAVAPAPPLAEPPPLERSRVVPPWMLGRFLVLVGLVVAGFLILRFTPLAEFLEPERLEALLEGLRSAWWTPLVLVALYLVLCPLGVPVSPMMVAAGIVFGAVPGALWNIFGILLAAVESYVIGRWLGRDLVVHVLGERLKPVEKLVERHGFWNLVRIRLVPVPFPIVNYGAALAGVPLGTFVVTSTLGLIPSVFIYTWFAATLATAVEGDKSGLFLRLGLVLAAVFLLTLLPGILRRLQRRRRYHRLLAERRQRRN